MFHVLQHRPSDATGWCPRSESPADGAASNFVILLARAEITSRVHPAMEIPPCA